MKVVFLERMVPDYRTRMFEILHDRLDADGIEFHLVAGQMRPGEDLNDKPPVGTWVHNIHNIYLYKDVHWPRMGRHFDSANMVIFHPHNSALGNFKLFARRYLAGVPKIGVFGHGGDSKADHKHGLLPFRERFKASLARLPDWWFPYTEASIKLMRQRGVIFPEDRITVVNNAIDVTAIMTKLSSLPAGTRNTIRSQLGILPDAPVGLYCGRMRVAKLGMLMDAVVEIKRKIPEFHLIMLGQGTEADYVVRFASENKWIHYLGSQYGEAGLPYFIASDVFLMPGRVGLAILDAFSAGLPLFTTNRTHSPEMAYFAQEQNGVMTDNHALSYADAVARLLGDAEALRRMSLHARDTARGVTMEAMVENFARGIQACLGQSPK